MDARMEVKSKFFNEACGKWLAHSKRSMLEGLTTIARGVIKRVIEYTPPGGEGVSSSEAKARGEKTVAAQIQSLMVGRERGVRRGRGEAELDPEAIHKANRTPDGKVRRVGHKVVVSRAKLNQYIAKKKKLVGWLASGWKAAAAKFNVRVPSWIARHNTGSAARVYLSDTGIKIFMENKVRFAGGVGVMRRRIGDALTGQAFAMVKTVAKKLGESAKGAGFKSK